MFGENGGSFMSEKRKKKQLVTGVLWMLLVGALSHPAAAAETTPAPAPAQDGAYTTPDITVGFCGFQRPVPAIDG